MDMSNLDEVPREEEEVRRMEGDRTRDRFPIDGSEVSRRLSVLLDVESEGCLGRKTESAKKRCRKKKWKEYELL